jgi:hypothetical protein
LNAWRGFVTQYGADSRHLLCWDLRSTTLDFGRELRRALRFFEEHYQRERNHQGVGNVLIMPRPFSVRRDAPVVRRPRLGGLRLEGGLSSRTPREGA